MTAKDVDIFGMYRECKNQGILSIVITYDG